MLLRGASCLKPFDMTSQTRSPNHLLHLLISPVQSEAMCILLLASTGELFVVLRLWAPGCIAALFGQDHWTMMWCVPHV